MRADMATVVKAVATRTAPRHFSDGGPRTIWTLPGSTRLGYVEYHQGDEVHAMRVLPADADAGRDDIVIEERILDRRDDDPEHLLEAMTARWKSFADVAVDAGGSDIYDSTAASAGRIIPYLKAACVGLPGSWAYGAATRHKAAWAMLMGARIQPHVDGLAEILRSCSALDGDLVITNCRILSATRKWIVEDACSNAVSIDGAGDVMTAMRMLGAIRSSDVKAA